MHIVDKEQDVTKVLEELCQWASPIYGAMNKWWVRRRNVNEHLLRRIEAIYSLEGFTGERGPGVREGRLSTSPNISAKGKEVESRVSKEDSIEVDTEVFDDDKACEQFNIVVDFLGSL
ncbi:hypothetical protein PHLCEN_2v1890 [Hermanssonia centrifuga]|uniref:Uncharacterized protein n=1 Tax=Hermanssonia centrifuga TaxID=98765 RepID=A0A2R6RVL5_9APHY|nr:hypothetical protein PHLCEN_2v1890 [Hermanssonia centrifuga]